MFQKTLLAIVMLCFGIGLGFGADLPRTIHFQFDDRPYLRGAGEAASRVTLDPETRSQDHGSLKIAHTEARTSAYSSFRVPAAPAKEVGEETGLAVWDFTIPEDRLQRPELKQLGK